jgi:hypothetical protein
MPDDISVSLIIAILSVLVGLLCLSLAIVAMVRMRTAPKFAGGPKPVETPVELRKFAAKQALSAIVMFALAAIIFYFS